MDRSLVEAAPISVYLRRDRAEFCLASIVVRHVLNAFGMVTSRLCGWLIIALSVPSALPQTTATFEGRKITDIRFAPLQALDASDLNKALALQKGDILEAKAVAESIDGLFATGRFEDIVVQAEPSGAGVILTFSTQLAWFVGNVKTDGNISAPPNRAQITAANQLSLGTRFHDEDIAAAVESIKQLLTSNGLYQVEVVPDVRRDQQNQEVYLTFTIKENKRAKYEMPTLKGVTLLPESSIVRATGWRVPLIHWWRQVTEARTTDGVRGVLSKYEKQDRLTAKVELEKLEYDDSKNRVQPTLSITPGPKIQVSAVEAKVSKRVLKRYVPVFEEHAVYSDLLVEGKRNLEDYFQSQGYYDAEAEFRVLPPANDLEKIEYVISRGPRYKLVRRIIQGNHYFSTDVIRERLFTQPAAFNLRHGRYSEAFRQKDEENISDLYRANGFRDVKVNTVVDRNYQQKAGNVAVTIQIDEGPQWLVDNLKITGIAQGNQKEIEAGLASIAGEPFADANLADDRNHILNDYYARGFPNATIDAAWTPSGKPNHVNLVYTIQEGDRQYVRDVLINGLQTTRRSLVERTLRIHPGDALSPTAQLEAQQRLYNLGVFARVETAIENPDGAEDHKYLLYSFEEANRYHLDLGFGAQVANFGTPSTTSLAAPGGTTGFSPQVSLGLQRLDFLGLGHTITLRGGYSNLQKRLSLSYLQPRLHNIRGLDVTYSLLYDHSLDIRTFASLRREASVQVSDRVSKSLTAILRFAYRDVSVSSIVIPVLLVPQFLAPVRIGMLSANIIQDRRNNADNPSRGMYNTVDLGIAGSFFGSQRSFARILLRNATYHHLTGQWILARQTRFGMIAPFSVPSDLIAAQSVPLPERFFGGGADSLRAFAFNQAGPRDIGASLVPNGPASQPTGFPIGGNALLFNNVELRFPLLGQNIQGVFFYDVGNVFSSLSDISFRFKQRNPQDFNYMVHAPGIGVRYRTPLGPIRLDLAYTVNPPSFQGFSGTPAQLLQCNPNLPASQLPGFCQGTPQRLGHIQFFFSIGQTF
jgi:outer membrane protein assembly complex protein YaeT